MPAESCGFKAARSDLVCFVDFECVSYGLLNCTVSMYSLMGPNALRVLRCVCVINKLCAYIIIIVFVVAARVLTL